MIGNQCSQERQYVFFFNIKTRMTISISSEAIKIHEGQTDKMNYRDFVS